MSQILKCHYCGTSHAVGDNQQCAEAQRIMDTKRDAYRVAEVVSSRNARRLARKTARKVRR